MYLFYFYFFHSISTQTNLMTMNCPWVLCRLEAEASETSMPDVEVEAPVNGTNEDVNNDRKDLNVLVIAHMENLWQSHKACF